ncbi:MAG: NADH-quinone oxidoreductase subunit C [Dehalococcoidia bacterium]
MPPGSTQLSGHRVAERLNGALPGVVVDATDEWVEVEPSRLVEALRWLHDSPEFDAAQLSNCCGVDRYDHFVMVYHLQSLDLNHQIAVKATVADHENPALPSAYPVYKGALLQEREVYDLMGIRFDGHPDLRRIFLWEGFPGHPLRKDFLGLGNLSPGLARFPFEDREHPDRLMNPTGIRRDAAARTASEQDVPDDWRGVAPA